MRHYYFEKKQKLDELISQYKELSHKGTASLIEETAYLRLIDHYEKTVSFEETLELNETALEHYPFSVELHSKKAKLLLNNFLPELALEVLEQAHIYAPVSIDIVLLKARAHINLLQLEFASILLNKLKSHPVLKRKEASEIHYLEACIFQKKEQYDQMFYSLKTCLNKNPMHKSAMEKLWFCVELAKKHKESLVFHEKLLDINPYNAHAWFNLGHAYYYLNEYEQAIEAFEYAFTIDEKFEFAYRDYAEVCMHIQEFEKALKCYQELSEHIRPDADVLLKMGECYKHKANYSKARICYFKSLSLDPENDEALFSIGACYAAEQHLGSAINFIKKAIELDDRREDYLAALADVYRQLSQSRKAISLYANIVELAPEDSVYWLNYADLYIAEGRYYRALEVLEEAFIYSTGAELLYCKTACLFYIEKRKMALDVLAKALTDNFKLHHLLYEYIPALKIDADVKAIVKYFQDE